MTDNKDGKYEMHVPDEYRDGHENHTNLGVILAILIVVLFLIFSGLYLWGSMLGTETVAEPVIVNDEPETPRAAADAQILETLSPSDELDAIEADLESTNLDSIDGDMTAIEAELNAQ